MALHRRDAGGETFAEAWDRYFADEEARLASLPESKAALAQLLASVRETVTFAYQKGGATLLDLLSAQRNDNEVRLAAAHAAADVIVARAALAAALNEKIPATSTESNP